MSPTNIFIYTLIILCILSIVLGFFYSDELIKNNPFLDKNLLYKGMNKPVIWLFYDHSDTNQRYWQDFGSRSSRALNIPFVNLCYQSIVKQNQNEYRIEVINGLAGLAELLGGWEHLPPGLQSPISPINHAEMNWIRIKILSTFGGLWLSPYTVCLKPFGILSSKITFFGTDIDETYSGKNGTTLPGFRAMWSPQPHHPMLDEWSDVCYKRLVEQKGGSQIRNDVKWDYIRFTSTYPNTFVIFPNAEGLRKENGKRIQLEDLLGSTIDGKLSFTYSSDVIYVPIPWTELRDRQMFGWFLRQSESQIMNSDLAIRYLLENSMNH